MVQVYARWFGAALAPNDRAAYCCLAFSNWHPTWKGPAASSAAPHVPDRGVVLHSMFRQYRGQCSTFLSASIPVHGGGAAWTRETTGSAPDTALVACPFPTRGCLPSHLAATSELRPIPEPNRASSTGRLPLPEPRGLMPQAPRRRPRPGMRCRRSLPERSHPGRFANAERCGRARYLPTPRAAPSSAAQWAGAY